MAKVIWNKENQQRLIEMNEIYTTEEIAEQFGASVSAIKNEKYKLGLGSKKEDEDNVPEGMKKCSKCKTILPLSEFYDKKNSKDGKQPYCKSCNALSKSLSYYRKKEEEKEKEIAAYMKKNKDKTFYCKYCNCEHTINDYFINYDKRKKEGSRIYKICKNRRRKTNNDNKIRKILNK